MSLTFTDCALDEATVNRCAFSSSFLNLDMNGVGMKDGIQCCILETIDSGKAKQGCHRFDRRKHRARLAIKW